MKVIMGMKVCKNSEYSAQMLTEGAFVPVDENSNFVMELPAWADENLIKRGQWFFFQNVSGMTTALSFGFFAVAYVETIANILMFTKQSSTPALAYRRFKANGQHLLIWYQNSLRPGTKAWKSLETVRKMHAVVNRRSTRAGVGIISQKDMAVTQFLFMGFQLLMPEKFGILGTRSEFEAFNHLWRVIGYMLGTEDRFNCCGETLEETKSRLQAIKEDIILPAIKMVTPEIELNNRTAFEGYWHSDLTMHYESRIFEVKRLCGYPGYHYFESESTEYEEENARIFRNLSLYTRFRIFLDILVCEYLSHVFVFHWLLNIVQIFLAILGSYPLIPLLKFGKKYALVEVMKTRGRIESW